MQPRRRRHGQCIYDNFIDWCVHVRRPSVPLHTLLLRKRKIGLAVSITWCFHIARSGRTGIRQIDGRGAGVVAVGGRESNPNTELQGGRPNRKVEKWNSG